MNLLSLLRGEANPKRKLAGLRDDLDKKLRRREDLLTLPLPPSDVVDYLVGLLEVKAKRYPEYLLNKLQTVLREPLGKPDATVMRFADFTFPTEGANRADLLAVEVMMAHFFLPQLKEGIARAMSGVTYTYGPPRAQREAELRKLDAEIAGLQEQIRSVRTELEQLQAELRPDDVPAGGRRRTH